MFPCIEAGGKPFLYGSFRCKLSKEYHPGSKEGEQSDREPFPPEYHRELLHPKGCLVFYYFGWELLDQLKETGFDKVNAHLYWSERFGYLGGGQMVFIATKSSEHMPHP